MESQEKLLQVKLPEQEHKKMLQYIKKRNVCITAKAFVKKAIRILIFLMEERELGYTKIYLGKEDGSKQKQVDILLF